MNWKGKSIFSGIELIHEQLKRGEYGSLSGDLMADIARF
jgi:hypothetical protein